MTFIILTGGIDLSVGSILGTTAVAAMVVSLIPEFAIAVDSAALMLPVSAGIVLTARWLLPDTTAVYRHAWNLYGAARCGPTICFGPTVQR